MINFKYVKWKNFLSTGNEFTKIQLDKTPSTLIVGSNGAGKSTLLDALSYSLFGKAHRDIKKDQLVNSINKKGTEVEVEFEIGGIDFKVRRTIKPTKFEIYQNGKIINQAANARDYQKFLEQNILKLNHKSFHQVVVLGSSSFIPFMQLPPWSRRKVIEDLLDINIFSKMNGLLKERNSKIKDELVDLDHNLELVKSKIQSQTKYIKDLQGINQDMIDAKYSMMKEHKTEIQGYISKSSELGENLSINLKEINRSYAVTDSDIRQLQRKEHELTDKIKGMVKEARFYEDNDHCPTCDHALEDSFKESKLTQIKEEANKIQNEMSKVVKQVGFLEKEATVAKKTIENLLKRQNQITTNNEAVSLLQKEIDKIQKDIRSLNGQSGDITIAKTDLSDQREKKDTMTEKKLSYVEERTYNEVIGEMLKDTGIKTKVIKQYLPVMNRFINQYLQTLDFFVAFHLDEAFNETIRSRHRDAFNYSSFSEGEKQRIDLALLFTWRMIAKMKNSAATNLLVLDETFDSSLDLDGIDNLTKILNTLEEGTNVFIISHKGDVLENKFRSKIEFYKDRNFSKIK